ncbi:MAG: hypothetical protein AB7L13_17000 [Acidimicrobiia bacterium]
MLRRNGVRTIERVETDQPAVVERDPYPSAMVVTPAQIMSAIGGLMFIAFGIFAVARAGLSGPLSDPAVNVLGLQHTAAIGLIEVGVGTVLLLCATSPATRMLSSLIGIALAVVGLLLLAGYDRLLSELNTESSFGWLPLGAGIVLFLATLMYADRR